MNSTKAWDGSLPPPALRDDFVPPPECNPGALDHPEVPVLATTTPLSAGALAALEYYANETNYVYGEYGHQLIAPIELDRGEKARKVIEQYARTTSRA